MLAKDADLAKLKFPLYVQPKLDGIRASMVDGKLVSRTLKPIPNAEIRAALELPEFEGLDGELIVGEPTAEDCYRKTTSFVMSQSKTGADWMYFVFDKHDHGGTMAERIEWLERWAGGIYIGYQRHLSDVAATLVTSAAELEAYEERALVGGWEGIIARTPDAPYKFGRSGKTGPLLKLKRFEDAEAEIIGVEEEMHNGNVATTNALGRTERSSVQANKTGKGTLGALVVRGLNGGFEGVEFKIGTGFDAAQRADLWLAWHMPLIGARATIRPGDVVKYKHFPIGVKDKPRHPVFLGFRDMEIDG